MAAKRKNLELSARRLARDPHLGAFIKKHGAITHRRRHSRSAFQSLARTIIFQQLSGKAAETILRRFIALFPGKRFPTPEDVLKIRTAKLRSAGISAQKSAYLKDLAQKCTDGTIDTKKFPKMTDEEVIAHVTAVKGIGEWTAHMFMMFTLGRPDILPTGDLGIQKGFKKLFGLKTLPTTEQMHLLAKGWRGHRTVACFYLWRLMDEN
ncbi:MAG: DNA-3-methyladenine glycosylase [Patescibacteria group bacterium]|nr:DNA-3-methyladenine glycosylase [Patescibacteria group bacterium]